MPNIEEIMAALVEMATGTDDAELERQHQEMWRIADTEGDAAAARYLLSLGPVGIMRLRAYAERMYGEHR